MRARAAAAGLWLAETLTAERERWALWLPVAFGTGIGAYFALPREPQAFSGWIAALLLFSGFWAWRRRMLARVLLLALLAAALGFALAQWRTARVAAPVLMERLGPVTVQGVIESLEPDGRTTRVILRPLAIERLEAGALPRRIRVRLPGEMSVEARPGAVLTVRVTLLPPPGPVVPGGYDFARDAWFRSLGAVGYGFGPGEVDTTAPAAVGWDLWWADLRRDWSQRLRALLPGDTGAVADALVTGERGGLSSPVEQAYRDSSLAHLLSISGLHVSLIVGLVFVSLRGGLALIPSIALRYPIKKWAALVSLLAVPLYTLLVGASIPTQRASLMVMIVLLAVLLDRRAISLRLIAWAAVVLLAWSPEALLSPSFQMSFGAVAALIAAYEVWMRRQGRTRDAGWWDRAWLYLAGVAFSSLIAGLATAPYAAFHFNRVSLYGIAANLIAVPITAVAVMPLALLSYVLFPLGLEDLALVPLGWSVDAINWVAVEVASWPGSALVVPAMPLWGLIVLTLGGLWLCIWSRPWRLAGVALLLLGCLSPVFERQPDILVSGDTKVIGLAAPDGTLWLSSRRAGRFSSDEWLELRGQDEAKVWWRHEAALAGWLRCDALGCLYRRDGRQVALVFDGYALLEDCWGNDLVIALLPIRRACPDDTPRWDRFALWREGALAVWVEEGGLRLQSVAAWRGERPWSPRRSGALVALPEEEGEP